MFTALPNDLYDRTVTVSTANGIDTYTVSNSKDNSAFTLSYPTGTPQSSVYQTINSIVPSTYVPPLLAFNASSFTFSASGFATGKSYSDNISRLVNNMALIATMAASNLPSWMLFNPTNGQLLATIPVGATKPQNILFTLTDFLGNVVTATVSFV